MGDYLTDYRTAIAALFARTTSGTKFGLERTRELLEFLGNPERRFDSIHVAGTNGKGSVVAMLDATLRAKGLRVGRYTSPHLIDFRERVTVGGKPISEEAVLRFLERTVPLAEEIGGTFFELTTALAFEHFADEAVDMAIVETGLGGRLDSTNVLTPAAAVVTSIGLDHTALLGETLAEIAREKAGIFKAGVPAVIGDKNSDSVATLRQAATTISAQPVVIVNEEYAISDVAVSLAGTEFTLEGTAGAKRIRTSLAGAHQARNAVIAIAANESLPLSKRADSAEIERGLGAVSLPGRFQVHGKFIFDVAHNPAAAAALAATLTAVSPRRPVAAVLSVLSDKDWRGVIDALGPVVDSLIITSAPSSAVERRWNPEEAAAYGSGRGYAARLEPDFDRALASATAAAGTVLVTGSFHTVGDAMLRLQVSPFAV